MYYCYNEPAYRRWKETFTTLSSPVTGPSEIFEKIFKWELQRYQARRAVLNRPEALKTCEHSGGMRNLYVAKMFRVTNDGLIDLPVQYDKLYYSFVEMKCSNCSLVASEPGLYVYGGILCVGSSETVPWRRFSDMNVHDMQLHVAGNGIILVLLQCRVAILSGSMPAYFPCPYGMLMVKRY